MRKIIRRLCSMFLLMAMATAAFGQTSYTETEPNNSFSTAGNMVNYDTLKAAVGGPDEVDFFKPDLAFWTQYGYSTGSIVVSVTATNTGTLPAKLFMDLYNGLQAAGLVYSDSTVSIPAGATRSATFRFCGQYLDDFYVAFRTNGTIDYRLVWYFSDPNPNAEPNNTRAAATTYTFDTLNALRQAINYQYRQNADTDTVDWLRTLLPPGNYTNIGLAIEAKNNSCIGGRSIQYALYRNNEAAPVLAGYVGNGASVGQFQTVYATIPLGNFQVGDNLYIRIWSNAAFGYNLQFSTGVRTLAHEPNDEPVNATPLAENEVLSSTIGEAINNDGYNDEQDYLRIITPRAGTLKVYVEAVNKSCLSDYNFIDYYLYDKNVRAGASASRSYYLGGTYWDELNCSSTLVETFTLYAVAADTFYFALFGYLPAAYKIRYEVVEEVTPDPEPNNTEATAIPLNAGEVKKGILGYKQASPFDNEDLYKITLPRAGNIRLFAKAVYKDPTVNNNTANRMRLVFSNAPTIRYVPRTNPPTQIVQNTAYLDTIRLCGLNAGDLYVRVQSGNASTLRPYHYEVSYELEPEVDSTNDNEPDNDYANATPVATGKKIEGLIGRTINGVMDMNDYHRIFVTGPDTLRVTFGGTNIGCVDNRILRLYGYNGRKQLIFFRGFILNAVGTVDAGQTVLDSIKYFVPAGDSIFLRMNADGLFNYHITTNLQVPSPVFYLTGDTTACTGPQYVYKAEGIVDENLTYHWSLPLGGGTLVANGNTATVTWSENAIKKISLYLSNARGNSVTRELNVIVSGTLPTATPVAVHFTRRLYTSSLPPGAWSQWYRNGTAIAGATDSTYYAADGGEYTVRFVNDCGEGPASNSIAFAAAAQPQTINYTKIGTVAMAPDLRLPLTATTSSGLPVLYQVLQGSASVVSDSARITGAGQVIIRMHQPGDDVYRPAADVYDTITVVKGAQVITFDSIPDKIFVAGTSFPLGANSSSGLNVGYTLVSGSGSIVGGNFRLTGAGSVTVRAVQAGNNHYNAATPVERTFCIGVRNITAITGDAAPCPATYRYTTQKIPGANYVWSLSGGGVLATRNDTAWVQWQTTGMFTLRVKANSACDTIFSAEQVFTATVSGNVPQPVSGMKPQNGATNQQLPLTLSWVPGVSTVSYDLYLWDSTATEPVTPFAANLTQVSFIVPKNALAYNKTYKWKVVSKNPCAQTAGPVQRFRVIPLPDLVVSDVQAPATANSGETITISWKVTNIGPGSTFTNANWYDGVYFALDTTPDFRNSPNWNASSWSSLTANGRPLLLGKKQRPTALDSGQFYTNSLQFTLPKQFSFPVYVYVITDNEHPNWKILQASVANDTARRKDPVLIQLSPTPDLRVDSVFAPVTTFSGSPVNLTYRVKNYGVVTPAGIGWTDSIFLSQNPFFDRNTAIPLKLPKADGSYYPNAVNAHTTTSTQLLPDSTLTKSLDVVIPNFLFGTWFIYVKTNADAKTALYEGAAVENNINRAQIQIILTPTPKLTVNTLLVPATTASTTQPFSINWNVRNEGFLDNIEKARGHYFDMGTCRVSCGPSAPRNSVCTAPSIIRDSVVFGSSYWVDKVYLSTDSTGLNTATARLLSETKHGTQYSGIYPPIINCPANYSRKLNVDNVIQPNSDYPKTAAFNLPSDLAPGRYYIYVHTNAGKDVFEYPGTPQIKRSAEAITVSRPDVVVSAISSPAAAVGGQTVAINYNVTNTGAGSVFNHLRKDQLYSSNFSTFDASATLLSTKTVSENIASGSSVSHSFNYQLPAATSGARYFYVVTNVDSSFRETNSNNNRSTAAMTMVSAAVPGDLTVNAIQLADTVFTIFHNTILYTVANGGTGTTAGSWVDSLFVSCSPVFTAATGFFVAERRQTRETGAGQMYTDTFSFAIPKMGYDLAACFPATAGSTAYFFVKTNADGGTYEGAGSTNNLSAPVATVLANPLVDHTVPALSTTADTATVGRTLGVRWTVKNIGYKPPYQYYNSYYDGIYFSTDAVWSTNDVLAASYLKYTLLNRGDSMNENKLITVPNLPTGDYYLFAKTNLSDKIRGEKVLSNNTALLRNEDGMPKKIHIIQPLLPDLVDSILSAPASVVAGQPITVVRRVTNRGAGVTYPANWTNNLRLSVDFIVAPNDGDRLLSQKALSGGLLPGQSRDDTITLTIPLRTVPGNYVLIGQADGSDKVIESNEANNLAFSLLTVLEPPVVDLLVENITHPDTVYLGYTLDTVKWTTRNNSPNEARGRLSEAVYLSQNTLFDSSAVLMGIVARTLALEALKDTAAKMTPLVAGVVEGQYNLFVKTDLLDNFLEEDEDNNATFSPQPVYVKVKELLLGVAEKNTLATTSRYYKLVIPDSLIGSTIMVTLKSADSLLVRNELYMAAGYVPTPARHDYKFEIPNYGNQQIVMTDVSQPVYYIEVRCATPNAAVQNIELKAVKLPFTVLNVQSPSGGNTGNVTVKISGSLFTEGMSAALQNGGTTIPAVQVYFTNSTLAYATFNLKGRPLGVYDVLMKKGDTATAVLERAFSVVPTDNGGLITGSGPNTGSSGDGSEPGCDPGAPSGLNSQLVVEMVVPPRVLLGRPIVILLNYSNPTNVDVAAQTRVLYSEAGLKMAFAQPDVPNGQTALYLELTEPGGPPGIIRAGGSGTITIYTQAPKAMPADPKVYFKLK